MAMSSAEEIPFCEKCMRKVEDGLRATILSLQSESGRVAVKTYPQIRTLPTSSDR